MADDGGVALGDAIMSVRAKLTEAVREAREEELRFAPGAAGRTA
jgi:hypothetical protein